MADMREGGCLCGAVRYSVDWAPMVVATCCCRNCQKQAGSSMSVIAMMPKAGLNLTGTLKSYEDHGESGNPLLRNFCPECGAPVTSEIPAAPELVIIKVGSLDDPSDVVPTLNYWTCSASSWVTFPEGSTSLEKQ
jgi:hypothetical protein